MIFEAERIWERGEAGEFTHYVVVKPRIPPLIDHNWKKCIATEEHFLRDERFLPDDDRYIVLRAHCFRAEDGSIGASGKMDPKEITIGGINYRQLAHKDPHCELCESGDMIPVARRFMSSSYRPA